MGCDIHMFPEKREDWGWRFVYRHIPDTRRPDSWPRPDRRNYFTMDDRWYWFFGQLAGVRHDGPPIAEPRGCPDDADDDVREFIQDSDYHTPSWLTLAELKAHDWLGAMRKDSSVILDKGAADHITEWLNRLAEIDPDPNRVRIVFAFDS